MEYKLNIIHIENVMAMYLTPYLANYLIENEEQVINVWSIQLECAHFHHLN